MSYIINGRRVNPRSIRVHESLDICDVYCVYAEFSGGDPLTEDELYELDELACDLLDTHHEAAIREHEIESFECELRAMEEDYMLQADYADRLKNLVNN